MILSAIDGSNMQQSSNLPKVLHSCIIPIHVHNVFPDWMKQGQCPPKKTALSDKWEAVWPSWDWATTINEKIQ